jgi:hypothetical protein
MRLAYRKSQIRKEARRRSFAPRSGSSFDYKMLHRLRRGADYYKNSILFFISSTDNRSWINTRRRSSSPAVNDPARQYAMPPWVFLPHVAAENLHRV